MGPLDAAARSGCALRVRHRRGRVHAARHPEIKLQSGNLLVSISRNTTSMSELFSNPEAARPIFAEVSLPR
jgi:hypothetical protein